MSVINGVILQILEGGFYGLIGAIAYRFLWHRDNHLDKKVAELKMYINRLEAKLYVSERLNNEWEIVWINQFGYKREMNKCQE